MLGQGVALQKETRLDLMTERYTYCEIHGVALSLRGKGIMLSLVQTNSFEKTKDKTGEVEEGGTRSLIVNRVTFPLKQTRKLGQQEDLLGYFNRPNVGREAFQVLILSSKKALEKHTCI